MEKNNYHNHKKEEKKPPRRLSKAEQQILYDKLLFPFKHVGAGIESIMMYNKDRFMVDLNHLGETRTRFRKYKKEKERQSAHLEELKEAAKVGGGEVEIVEEDTPEFITPEDILDVHPLTYTLLEVTDEIQMGVKKVKKALLPIPEDDSGLAGLIWHAFKIFMKGV